MIVFSILCFNWCDFSEVAESKLVINRAVWGPLNKTIISAGEDAVVRIWDAEVSFSNLSCLTSCQLRVILVESL